MLTMKKSITLTGESRIDDVLAERYTAVIDYSNPGAMAPQRILVDKALAKESRETCRTDWAAFEDAAYALQDEITASEE